MYKLITSGTQEEPRQTLLRVADNSSIPFDNENSDYQAYLLWLSEGNVPEPADTQGAA
jgi:hypothetical protein